MEKSACVFQADHECLYLRHGSANTVIIPKGIYGHLPINFDEKSDENKLLSPSMSLLWYAIRLISWYHLWTARKDSDYIKTWHHSGHSQWYKRLLCWSQLIGDEQWQMFCPMALAWSMTSECRKTGGFCVQWAANCYLTLDVKCVFFYLQWPWPSHYYYNLLIPYGDPCPFWKPQIRQMVILQL